MLDKVKKYAVILVIAILYAFFSFSLIELVVEQPEYEKYCRPEPVRIESKDCDTVEIPPGLEGECEGYLKPVYNSTGCPVSYTCDTCRVDLDQAQEKFRFYGFIITSFMGIVAILFGLYMKTDQEVVEWVYSGILIGGIISVFIGTMMYFGDMNRFAKPIVLFFEIALVVWIAVKTSRRP